MPKIHLHNYRKISEFDPVAESIFSESCEVKKLENLFTSYGKINPRYVEIHWRNCD